MNLTEKIQKLRADDEYSSGDTPNKTSKVNRVLRFVYFDLNVFIVPLSPLQEPIRMKNSTTFFFDMMGSPINSSQSNN